MICFTFRSLLSLRLGHLGLGYHDDDPKSNLLVNPKHPKLNHLSYDYMPVITRAWAALVGASPPGRRRVSRHDAEGQGPGHRDSDADT